MLLDTRSYKVKGPKLHVKRHKINGQIKVNYNSLEGTIELSVLFFFCFQFTTSQL